MKVTCTIGRTINIGNYESVRVDFGVEVVVKEGETPTAAFDRAQKIVEARVNGEVSKIESKLKG